MVADPPQWIVLGRCLDHDTGLSGQLSHARRRANTRTGQTQCPHSISPVLFDSFIATEPRSPSYPFTILPRQSQTTEAISKNLSIAPSWNRRVHRLQANQFAYSPVHRMSIPNEPALRLLHYASPFALVLGAFFLWMASVCVTAPSKRRMLAEVQGKISSRLSIAVSVLYAFECFVHGLRKVFQPGWYPDAATIFYASLCFLIWIIVILIQEETAAISHLPSLGTWMLAAFLEITILFVHWHKANDLFDYFQLAVLSVRASCISLLCSYNLPAPESTERDFESSPYPYDKTMALCKKDPISVDNEVKSDTKIYARRHQARLEQLGGFWCYFKEVKYLISYIIPTDYLRSCYYGVFILLLLVSYNGVSRILEPRLLGDFVEKLNVMKNTGNVPWRHFLIFVVKMSLDGILPRIRNRFSIQFSFRAYRRLLYAAVSHLLGLSQDFHGNKQTGEVQAAVDEACKIHVFIDDCVDTVFPILINTIITFGYSTLILDVYIGLILAMTYMLYGVVTYRGVRWFSRLNLKSQGTLRFERNYYYETIANWEPAFYFNRQDYQRCRLDTATKQQETEALRAYDISQLMQFIQNLVILLGYFLFLCRSAYIALEEDRAVGDAIALLFSWNNFVSPLFGLERMCRTMGGFFVDLECLLEIMQTRPSVTDAEGAQDLVFRGGKVEFRNVSFSYDGKDTVINDLSCVISPGSTVAFVGKTGKGKSTICDKLLFRGYDVTQGAILVDDQDIREVTQWSLRETLGIVRQEQSFYNDSILEAVRFARLDATDEEVYRACKHAAIHDQIIKFPNGYQSRIGERGVKLSGGQKQRLAIAQLFLRGPKIVVLDEATSNVDNITERQLQESFAKLWKGRTTIVIAHRLSTVQHADQIFFLGDGTIVERGTHDELLALKGEYYRHWHK